MIKFYTRDSFEENWKEVGILDNSGIYKGKKSIKEIIDQKAEMYGLNLSKKEDQKNLRAMISGSYIEATEVD